MMNKTRLLGSVRAVLNGLPAEQLADPRMLARILTVLRNQRGALGGMMAEVADSPSLLQECASRSYLHGNGFAKLMIARGPQWALRLHVHGPAEGLTTPASAYHVHDHRWPFASTVLRGTLYEDRFEHGGVPVAGESWVHFRYRAEESLDGAPVAPQWSAARVGTERLRLVARLRHPAGSVYAVGLNDLHALPPMRDACSTLVLTGAPSSAECNLYSRPEVAPPPTTTKVALSPEAVASLLQTEVAALEEAAPDPAC
jgi:hypothetical protein